MRLNRSGDCVLRQHNDDLGRVCPLVVAAEGGALGYPPVTMTNLTLRWDGHAAVHIVPEPPGDPELGAELASARWHDLGALFHYVGYPAELVAWIEATPGAGRPVDEVAARLSLDAARLARAGLREAQSGRPNPIGDPIYFTDLSENWAATVDVDGWGDLYVAPNSLRFKAWLSLEYGIGAAAGHHHP